ncbi:hypothetical protein pipiens_019249 [Culex pipiens pipiens]|uniref:Uncharacterized protein n=1 Tax=Culex pipiens pipiens TaxID=38569 RepID=A0ABD1DVF2_CULPP
MSYPPSAPGGQPGGYAPYAPYPPGPIVDDKGGQQPAYSPYPPIPQEGGPPMGYPPPGQAPGYPPGPPMGAYPPPTSNKEITMCQNLHHRTITVELFQKKESSHPTEILIYIQSPKI